MYTPTPLRRIILWRKTAMRKGQSQKKACAAADYNMITILLYLPGRRRVPLSQCCGRAGCSAAETIATTGTNGFHDSGRIWMRNKIWNTTTGDSDNKRLPPEINAVLLTAVCRTRTCRRAVRMYSMSAAPYIKKIYYCKNILLYYCTYVQRVHFTIRRSPRWYL